MERRTERAIKSKPSESERGGEECLTLTIGLSVSGCNSMAPLALLKGIQRQFGLRYFHRWTEMLSGLIAQCGEIYLQRKQLCMIIKVSALAGICVCNCMCLLLVNLSVFLFFPQHKSITLVTTHRPAESPLCFVQFKRLFQLLYYLSI